GRVSLAASGGKLVRYAVVASSCASKTEDAGQRTSWGTVRDCPCLRASSERQSQTHGGPPKAHCPRVCGCFRLAGGGSRHTLLCISLLSFTKCGAAKQAQNAQKP